MPWRLRLRYTLHQLQIFLAVVQHGGVSRAAAALHLAQPTVSMQLRQLREALGAALLEHGPRGLRVTPAGEEVLAVARVILNGAQSLEERLALLAGARRGRLKVAAASTAEYFIPRLLGEFQRAHPDVEVELAVVNRAAVVARLEDDRDDLYVMTRPPSERPVVAEPIAGNPLVVVAPNEHPLALRRHVPVSELARHEFVLRERGAGTRLVADAHFAAHSVVLPARLELGSNEAVKQAVIGGLGLAVLSLHALRDELLHHRRIRILQVTGFPIPGRWHWVRRAEREPTPVATALRQFVAAHAPALEAELERLLAAGGLEAAGPARRDGRAPGRARHA